MTFLAGIFDAFARVSVFYMFNSIWIGCVLVFLLWGLLRIFRHVPAHAHHRMIWFGLLAILIAPFFLTPKSNYDLVQDFGARVLSKPFSVTEQGDVEIQQAEPPSANLQALSHKTPSNWPLYTAVLWGCVSGFLFVRLVAASFYLRLTVRSGTWEDAEVQRLFEACKKRCTGRDVRLRFAKKIRGPMAVGVLNPMILMPESLVGHLSKDELEQVLLHELAHIDRQDVLGIWVQRFIEVFLWINPAIWVLSNHLSLTREMACDDWAVRLGKRQRSYAFCLTHLAELIHDTKSIPVVGVGVGSSLKQRIEYLLRTPKALGWVARRSAWIGGGLILLVCGFCLNIGPWFDVPGRAEAHLRLSKWNATLADFLIGNPLPRGVGLSSKIVVVANEIHWQALEPILLDVLTQPILTPQPESVFEIVHVLPERFDQHRVFRNVIVIGHPNSRLGDIVDELGSGQNVIIRKDVWAADQVVIGVRAKDVVMAEEQIALNADRIVSAIDDAMADWLTSILYHAGVDEVATRALLDRYGWKIQVPVGFNVMRDFEDQNFVTFARQVDRRQLWMWVYWEDGVRSDQLTDEWCLEKRNAICRQFFNGDQTALGDLQIREADFEGRLAVSLEGLWENGKTWQGGPFKSYALLDADRERFYMIEMGIYAPSRSKALHVRQLDALAHTFEIPPSYVMK